MDKPETLATVGTQDIGRTQTKQKLYFVLFPLDVVYIYVNCDTFVYFELILLISIP
jgi:hypothetical protein